MGAEWTMADAWVFAAIAGDRPDDIRSLRQVIGIADAINHAILMEEEFTRAVGRLLGAGLIEADPAADHYQATAAGRALHRRCRGGWIDTVPAALHALGEPRDGHWALPEGAFQQAVRRYLDS